jgi:hypothetical protein
MDAYSTGTLVGVVQNLQTPPSFLQDRYFPRTLQFETEEIHVDRLSEKRRIAPFVAPFVSGQIVEALGRRLLTLKPAYIKDKRVFDPTVPIPRAVGERIGGGEFTNQQRRDAHVAIQLQDQLNMLSRRMEVMASEVLRTGKETIVGEKYPEAIVDFLRDPALTVADLAGTARWGQSAAAPLANLRAWQKLVRQGEGANPVDVLMGDDAFEAFLEDPKVQKRLDQRWYQGTTFQPGQKVVEGGSYQGTIDGFNIITVSGWYVDPMDDTVKEIWPANEVVLASPFVEGVRAYGAIRDGKAGLRAMPYFPKFWEENDPAVEFMMLQSAPLLVPLRPNASVKVKVLD